MIPLLADRALLEVAWPLFEPQDATTANMADRRLTDATRRSLGLDLDGDTGLGDGNPIARGQLFRSIREDSRSLGARWDALREEVDQLDAHKVQLREEWAELELERERLYEERQRFEDLVTQEWFHGGAVAPEMLDRIVRLNVGGQIFEITARLLLRDRFSLLAAACGDAANSILRPDADGCFYFDRDWWLFRHILTFLRDGVLPQKLELLRDLYHEAGFYCLGTMQREIEALLAERRMKGLPVGVDAGAVNWTAGAKTKSGKLVGEALARGSDLASVGTYNAGAARTRYAHAAGPLPDPFGFTQTVSTRGPGRR